MKNEASRERWVDIAKGFAIVLVVLGHAIRDDMRIDMNAWDFIYRCCYVFHMSFFFWISGYTYEMNHDRNHKDVLSFVKKKLQRLLVPWVLYTLFIYFTFYLAMMIPKIATILSGSGYNRLSIKNYLIMCLQGNNPWSIHLWFIYVLFIINLIVFLVECICKKNEMFGTSVILIVTLSMGYFLKQYSFGSFSRILNYIALYTPFFILGKIFFLLKNSNKYTVSLKKSVLLLWGGEGIAYIVIRAVFYSGFSGNTISTDSMIIKMLVYYLAYIMLPGIMILLALFFEMQMHTIIGKLFGILERLGRNSFEVYLFHQPFCCAFVATILFSKMRVPAIISVLICIVLSFVIPLGIKFIFNSIKKREK